MPSTVGAPRNLILASWLWMGLAGFSLPAASHACPGAVAVANLDLRIHPPAGGESLPLRHVNNLPAGAKISYQPTRLPADIKKDAKVTLVVMPAWAQVGQVSVLDLKPAGAAAEWTTPYRVGVVALIFGPQGLDDRRITSLVSKDDELIQQLADYAAQTYELEQTIDAISDVEAEPEEEPSPDRANPTDQAVFALVRALNPIVAAYSPLGAGRRMATMTMTGRAASGFFENAGGLFPGSEALGAMKGWLFPDTEFRATFAEDAGAQGVTLCAQRQQARSRNRMAYVWAYRAIDSGPPTLALWRATHLPIGIKSSVAVKASNWSLIDRVRNWTLPARPSPQGRFLDIDLTKYTGAPGPVSLTGKWDWTTVGVAGELHLDPLPDLRSAHVAGDSLPHLVEGSGPVPIRLEGTDLQFVDRVTLRRLQPVELPVAPSRRDRTCPQPQLQVEIDTNSFRAGRYILALAQAGRPPQEIPLQITSPPPRIDNLPLRAHQGDVSQPLLLRGSGLDRIDRLESDQAEIRLGGGSPTERPATIQLRPSVKKGDRVALSLRVAGVDAPLPLPDAIEVVGPRPRIVSSAPSLPPDLGVALREGELPAGSFVGLSLRAENVEGPATLLVRCGERETTLDLRPLRPGEFFASFEPPAACLLTALLSTEAGRSDPFPLGRAFRLPRIDTFTMTDEKLSEGVYAALLKGTDLETIEKTAWDPRSPQAVSMLPVPAGNGPQQTLKIALPWPSPAPRSPLLVWLRQDTEPRLTKSKY